MSQLIYGYEVFNQKALFFGLDTFLFRQIEMSRRNTVGIVILLFYTWSILSVYCGSGLLTTQILTPQFDLNNHISISINAIKFVCFHLKYY